VRARRIGPTGLLTGAAAATAGLWVLGRLKLVYYYSTFGVDVGSLELTFADQLFESWFTAQNVLFVVLLWWIALKTRAVWVAAIALAHALIPIASHYAFVYHDLAPAGFLIRYRHTLLKLVPFAALGLILVFQPGHRRTLRDLRPPLPPAGSVLFAVIVLSWAISSAKHFGSFDAQLALREPAAHLARVRLASSSIPAPHPDELYVLHAGADRVVLWDSTGFRYGETDRIRTLVVSRSTIEWLEGHKAFQIQPANRFL
jgi:hypothetical protein